MARKLYISYAEEDQRFRDAFVKHLAVLVRQDKIAVTDVGSIGFMGDTRDARLSLLREADIVVLLISKSFFASDECNTYDLTDALSRSKRDKVPLIVVRLSPCFIEGTPLENWKILPDGKGVVGNAANDKVWSAIATVIQKLAVQPRKEAAHAPVDAHDSTPPKGTQLPKNLKLTGKEEEAFVAALVSAFISYDELSRMVRFTLDARLPEISPPGPLPQVAFDLIAWVGARTRTAELLLGAVEKNPGNEDLRRFFEEIAERHGTLR